jgi:hypothetical protein
MSLVFLAIKLFPFFGISIAFIFFDLSKSFYRKGNKTWVGMVIFSLIFLGMTGAWVYLRGDRNADIWFENLVNWLHHG